MPVISPECYNVTLKWLLHFTVEVVAYQEQVSAANIM